MHSQYSAGEAQQQAWLQLQSITSQACQMCMQLGAECGHCKQKRTGPERIRSDRERLVNHGED